MLLEARDPLVELGGRETVGCDERAEAIEIEGAGLRVDLGEESREEGGALALVHGSTARTASRRRLVTAIPCPRSSQSKSPAMGSRYRDRETAASRVLDETSAMKFGPPMSKRLVMGLALSGYLDGAWAAFNQVIQQDPKNAAAIYHLGVVQTAKGELELARDAFRAAAQLDPQYAGDLKGAEQRLGLRQAVRTQNAQ